MHPGVVVVVVVVVVVLVLVEDVVELKSWGS